MRLEDQKTPPERVFHAIAVQGLEPRTRGLWCRFLCLGGSRPGLQNACKHALRGAARGAGLSACFGPVCSTFVLHFLGGQSPPKWCHRVIAV